MILVTATNHFNEDIQRAKDILAHANALSTGLLKGDLLRASWMMAVGALNAFSCDAYGDLITRTLRAKIAESTIQIPDRIRNLKVPAYTVL